MRPAERGFLLLCTQLGEADVSPLTIPQFRQLRQRVMASKLSAEDSLRELSAKDFRGLGYDEFEAQRMLWLLSREERLDCYLTQAERCGVKVVTRLNPAFPQRLFGSLQDRCPSVLFCVGEVGLLQSRCLSLVGSRKLAPEGITFAKAAGKLIAENGFTYCSGGASGADSIGQLASMEAGGSAVIFPAVRLLDCKLQENTVYACEGGFDLPFSVPRALARNRLIHAMGEKALVAQVNFGSGGTWSGTIDNLRHGYSPVFVHDDGSDGAKALMERGAVGIGIPRSMQALDLPQKSFFE